MSVNAAKSKRDRSSPILPLFSRVHSRSARGRPYPPAKSSFHPRKPRRRGGNIPPKALNNQQDFANPERTAQDAGLPARRRIPEIHKRKFLAPKPFFCKPSAGIAGGPAMAVRHPFQPAAAFRRQPHADHRGTSRFHSLPSDNVTSVSTTALALPTCDTRKKICTLANSEVCFSDVRRVPLAVPTPLAFTASPFFFDCSLFTANFSLFRGLPWP